MDREKVYSSSLGISDLDKTFGRWIRYGNEFVENDVDFWHAGTRYYIADNVDLGRLENRLCQALLYCDDDDLISSLYVISKEVVFLPIANYRGSKVCLFSDTNGQYTWLSSLNLENCNLRNLDIKELNVKDLSNQKQKILPISKSYSEFMELSHHYGDSQDYLQNENSEDTVIILVPVIILKFKVKDQMYVWVAIDDKDGLNVFTPHQFKNNPRLIENYDFTNDIKKQAKTIRNILFFSGAVILLWILWNTQGSRSTFDFICSVLILLPAYLLLTFIICGLIDLIIGIFVKMYNKHVTQPKIRNKVGDRFNTIKSRLAAQ